MTPHDPAQRLHSRTRRAPCTAQTTRQASQTSTQLQAGMPPRKSADAATMRGSRAGPATGRPRRAAAARDKQAMKEESNGDESSGSGSDSEVVEVPPSRRATRGTATSLAPAKAPAAPPPTRSAKKPATAAAAAATLQPSPARRCVRRGQAGRVAAASDDSPGLSDEPSSGSGSDHSDDDHAVKQAQTARRPPQPQASVSEASYAAPSDQSDADDDDEDAAGPGPSTIATAAAIKANAAGRGGRGKRSGGGTGALPPTAPASRKRLFDLLEKVSLASPPSALSFDEPSRLGAEPHSRLLCTCLASKRCAARGHALAHTKHRHNSTHAWQQPEAPLTAFPVRSQASLSFPCRSWEAARARRALGGCSTPTSRSRTSPRRPS
jgi:hypothetical protein